MSKEIRFLLGYALAAAALWVVLEPAPSGPPELEPPLLPVEAAVDGAAASAEVLSALRADAFRWVAPRGAAPVWRRGLTVDLTPDGSEAVRAAVFERGLKKPAPVWSARFRRVEGADGDAATAAVIARLLWSHPAVEDASQRAYLDNQTEVARLGGDLWRAGRWQAAADTLYAALENDWAAEPQAQLYFGLADAYAHLGRPRQAFWYALGYLALSGKEPPAGLLKTLRGVSGLVSAAQSGAEPEVQELLRRRARHEREGSARLAFDDLKRLCQLAPWAADYQLEAAAVYDRLGWRALADSWKRRAALTRRLAADAELQGRLSELAR